MHIKWIAKMRKPARPNGARPNGARPNKSAKSPKIGQVVAIVLVALIAVAGLVLAAYQATPPKAAAATTAVQPASTQTDMPANSTTTKRSAAPHAANANAAQAPERVTITGCLEENHDVFKLKDTEGVDAPKSRNWKTGFLTKHAASVTLLDQKNRMKLGSHVGERVSVSGMLSDRDIEVRSISRVANTCD
jgi:hypothetical protein